MGRHGPHPSGRGGALSASCRMSWPVSPPFWTLRQFEREPGSCQWGTGPKPLARGDALFPPGPPLPVLPDNLKRPRAMGGYGIMIHISIDNPRPQPTATPRRTLP